MTKGKVYPNHSKLRGITPLQLILSLDSVCYQHTSLPEMYGWLTQDGQSCLAVINQEQPVSHRNEQTLCPYIVANVMRWDRYDSHKPLSSIEVPLAFEYDLYSKIVNLFKYCCDLEYNRGELANSSPKQVMGYPLPIE